MSHHNTTRRRGKKSKKKQPNNNSKKKNDNNNNNKNAQATKPTMKKKKTRKKYRPVLPASFVVRLILASIFLFSLYCFKEYYVKPYVIGEQTPQNNKQTNNNNNTLHNNSATEQSADGSETEIDTEVDVNMNTHTNNTSMRAIFNVQDYNLNAKKVHLISERVSFQRKKALNLKLWSIEDLFNDSVATEIAQQLRDEFMDEELRRRKFLFAYNAGNEKIRGNDDIARKLAHAKRNAALGRFSYAKYEYKRQEPLYARLLAYLNSSFVVDHLMSKLFNERILGITDLFVSVFWKNNFLSMHDDRSLGNYAFIIFLSPEWRAAEWGGSLHMNCDFYHAQQSCLEIEPRFNKAVFFQVFPKSIPHFVQEVVVEQPRIAITGWYFNDQPGSVNWAALSQEIGYGLQ